jgi:hypothetical protein
MPQEFLFDLNDVPAHVASIGATSYQISSIGSVHVVHRKKRNPVVVVVFLLGLGVLATAIVASRTTGLPDDTLPWRQSGFQPWWQPFFFTSFRLGARMCWS